MHVAGQDMDVGMAAAAAVYPLGWFDAAMVHGGGGWVLGDS